MAGDDGFREGLRERGVFFLLPHADAQLHWSICLAEGFAELGIPFFANLNACRRPDAGGDWLFRETGREPRDCWLVVGDISCAAETTGWERLIDALRAMRHRAALLCMADTATTLHLPDDLPCFVAHANRRVLARGWRIPWAFGLSRQMLAGIAAARSEARRSRAFVRNFRPSLQQGVRNALDLAFVPRLKGAYAIDRQSDGGGRFKAEHYRQLAGAFGCLAYGGEFYGDVSLNEHFRAAGYATLAGDDPAIIRWDSWRLWESLAAGCLTVALDFAAYDLLLPEPPVDRRHYVGLRFDALADARRFLADTPPRKLARIAAEGQAWALANYTPKATAERFIATVARCFP